MKKLLLATAVAALSVSAANAAPTVYGKAFLTLDAVEADVDNGGNSSDADERTALNSNSSRIGLKGSEALTANTDILYQLEYGIDIDAGETFVDADGARDSSMSDQFYARDTYLGLQNDQYGTLLAGRLTAIDDYVNYASVADGGVLGGDSVLTSFDAPRINNSFAYFTPENNGLQFMAMYALDEEDSSDVTEGTDTLDRDAFGLGAKYEMGPMNVGATYIQSGDFKAARVSGNYAISPAVTLGALYQNTDYDTDDNENSFTLSGEMATATPWTAYAQGDITQNYAGSDDFDAYRVLAGGKYAFNPATTGHIYGAYLNKDESGSDYDGVGIGGGIEYKF